MLGSGEGGRERGYVLGRRAAHSSIGLLHVVRVHQEAVRTLIESTHAGEECLRRVQLADDFLLDALAAYEMAWRGFVETLPQRHT
jgi:hypothetical protein